MQNRQHLEAQKLVMLSQHLWPPHDTPPNITSFQTQTLLHLINHLRRHFERQTRPASGFVHNRHKVKAFATVD